MTKHDTIDHVFVKLLKNDRDLRAGDYEFVPMSKAESLRSSGVAQILGQTLNSCELHGLAFEGYRIVILKD